ncbi:MAG: hypothetical protein U0Q03_09195 [Acidimicrobiales bacterium]
MNVWRRLVVVAALLVGCVPGGPSVRAETIDGEFDGIGQLEPGRVYDLPVLGRAGVPATHIDSVALNVTVTNPWAPGYLTVWPTGEPQPASSNLNFVRAQTVPNTVVVKVGVDGKVSLALFGSRADVIVDVLGWFTTGGGFTGLTPARLMDSRADGVTVDGSARATGKLLGGTNFELTVGGRGGVPADAGTVVLNVTLTNPTASGYLTVWPTGQPRPNASNLNVVPGETRPNLVIVPLGAGGQVSMFLFSGAADVVVDVFGWFEQGGEFRGVTPARLMDSRADGTTVDGAMRATGVLRAGEPIDLLVTGRGGVPSNATSVALNVTVTNPTDAAYLTVYPSGAPRPTASNLNVLRGQTVPNLVLAGVGDGGKVSVFLNKGSADVVIDVLGYVVAPTGYAGMNPTRLMETRGEWITYPMPVGSEPGSIAFDGSSMWVASRVYGGLSRVDPASGATERVAMPNPLDTPQVVLFDGRYVWAAGSNSSSIAKFDPVSGRLSTFSARGAHPRYLASDGQYLWFTDAQQAVIVRVDRSTGSQRRFTVPFDPASIGQPVALGGWLWFPVFGPGSGTGWIGGLDMTTGAVTRFEVPGLSSWALTTDGALLWAVAVDRTGYLGFSLIDPITGVTVRSSSFGATQTFFARQLMFDGKYVWAVSDFGSQLARVDVASGQVKLFAPYVDALAPNELPLPYVPNSPYAITTDGTYLWTANLGDSLTRVPRSL